jgi:hypothetical protein
MVRDPIRHTVTPATAFNADPQAKTSRFSVPASSTPIVVDFNYGAASTYVSRADVASRASLSVDEIVFRHQQAQAAQAEVLRAFSATMEMRIHFRPSSTQVFDVLSENRVFADRDTVEWEELSFSVNGAKYGPDRPGFPLLQAEKVLSLPLDLRLTADYRYQLVGTESVDGHRCYVIDFSPVDLAHARLRGRVWIDEESFLRVKVDAIQTHLQGEIVSSQVTDTYAPVGVAEGRSIYLPTHSTRKEQLLVAGRNLLLERDDWYTAFQIDPPDFESQRASARESNRIMFRDTPEGVRYLVKQGGERVVSDKLTNASKALALGTTIDPTFGRPLPIAGINYLNFHFLGTDSQFAMLFGGVFIAGNLQKPKLGPTPLQGSIDFFGIAAPGTNEVFDRTGERVQERVMTLPSSTGANLGWQFTPFQKVAAGYQFQYDKYFAGTATGATFVVPSSTVTHGLVAGYDFKRRGYAFGASAGAFHRMSWQPWGDSIAFDPGTQNYTQYSVGAAKDFLVGPFQTFHAGAGWYSGNHLDRFSMYEFGLFADLRMHGVPSSGIRFPALALFRGSYSFNVLNLYKLDLFLDHARARDPGDRTTWQSVTGTGVAVTFRGPWNTMFNADVGKSLLPTLYRPAGSVVLQFMLLKPLSR